jgi:hypothetical protein
MRPVLATLGLLAVAGCATPAPAPPPASLTVRFFVGTECPVSNFYAAEMRRLAEIWGPRGVAFQAVYPEPGIGAADALRHADRYGLPFPVVMDVERVIAAECGVTRVPTAVIDGAYRGRIDDRFSPDGRRRDEPRTHDLEDALSALAEGRAPAVRETPVFGCPLP